MLSRAKHTAARVVATRRVYRVLPPGGLRTYAALKYHGQHSSPEHLARFVRSMGSIPTRWLPTAVLAARAAFRTGQDDLLDQALTALERRHPDAVAVQVLRADLLTFYGRYAEALRIADRARRLQRSSAAATARSVRLGYRVRAREDADQLAVSAVERFPLTAEVLWPVAMACDSAEQYQRIQTAWLARVPQPLDLLRVVRQLAVAAGRAEQLDAAADLYRRAIVLLVESGRAAPRVSRTRLHGLGARTAIDDLCGALDGAGVPFFFAAGTALGLVRNGRPLSADNDLDVGVLDDDWDRDALIDLFTHHPRFDLDLHPQTQKVGLRHRGGSPVDVFRFYQQDGQVWHDGVFVRWHNTPFRVSRREVNGLRVPLPEDAERYLTENYGDWRTPDPGFDAFTDDAPNLEVTWPEYQRVHLVRRAYEYLAAGDPASARHELQLAGEDELAAGIGRSRGRHLSFDR